jgi:hypothetical protein
VEHVVQFDATRRTLPGLNPLEPCRDVGVPFWGASEKVLHGCRQLVS